MNIFARFKSEHLLKNLQSFQILAQSTSYSLLMTVKATLAKLIIAINIRSPRLLKNQPNRRLKSILEQVKLEARSTMIGMIQNSQLQLDSVCIQSICAQNLPLILMKDSSDMPFLTAKFDGVLGLGRRRLGSNSQITNIVQMLYHQKKILDNSFSLYFSRGTDDKFASQLILGGQSNKLYEKKMDYIEVIDQPDDGSHWRVQIDQVTIGTKTLDLCICNIDTSLFLQFDKIERKCFAYFDSGSQYIGGDSAFIQTIIDTLDLSNDCKNLQKMKFIKQFKLNCQTKVLRISIQGHEYLLQPEDYILQKEVKEDVVDKNGSQKIESLYKCALQFTKIAFDSQNKTNNLVLGLPFLKKYYTSYIFQSKRNTGIPRALVGVAPAVHSKINQLKYF